MQQNAALLHMLVIAEAKNLASKLNVQQLKILDQAAN